MLILELLDELPKASTERFEQIQKLIESDLLAFPANDHEWIPGEPHSPTNRTECCEDLNVSCALELFAKINALNERDLDEVVLNKKEYLLKELIVVLSGIYNKA